MLKNYLLTAFRNLRRERWNTTLNIVGLTLGMAGSLILFLMVQFHSNFDRHHANLDRIYRVVTESNANGNQEYTAGVPPVLPDAFQLDFPEAEEVTFLSYRNNGLVVIPQRSGEEPLRFQENRGLVYAQPNVFRVLSFTTVTGDPAKALAEPNQVVISESKASRYFGTKEAIGQVLRFEDRDYKVAAILKDPPAQTDFPFSLFFSYVTIEKEAEANGWNSTWSDEQCYVLLKADETPDKVHAGMPGFVKKYLGDNKDGRTFSLQPLTGIHFDERFSNYNYQTISSQLMITLSIVGLVLLITSCINFINLATAEAFKRSREVGVRKALGGTRTQLAFQFLGETSIVSISAVALATILVHFVLPYLTQYIGVELMIPWGEPSWWLILLSCTIFLIVCSGAYPAFILSSFKPVFALKNMNTASTSGLSLRLALVVTQFVISQVLLIGTLVIVSQMDFFLGKEMGFRKEAVITVDIPVNESPSGGVSKMRTLRDEVTQLSGVETASLSNTPPASGSVAGTSFSLEGNTGYFETQVKTIDGNYIGTYDIALVAGTNVEDLDTARGFLVNEQLARMVGFENPADLLGKRITMWRKTLPVVGVVKDFNTVSLHDKVAPTILLNRIRNFRTLSVVLKPGNQQATIEEIKKKWELAYPEQIFSYVFLDEDIKNFYSSEQQMSELLTMFTSLAIFIGCLGLFGLASYSTGQRTKEIGVRKVLGATAEGIMLRFYKQFSILVFVGFLIATPVSWLIMNEWLSEFAYRVDLSPVVFLKGLGISLTIALITVGYKTYLAASMNPAKSLRSE